MIEGDYVFDWENINYMEEAEKGFRVFAADLIELESSDDRTTLYGRFMKFLEWTRIQDGDGGKSDLDMFNLALQEFDQLTGAVDLYSQGYNLIDSLYFAEIVEVLEGSVRRFFRDTFAYHPERHINN